MQQSVSLTNWWLKSKSSKTTWPFTMGCTWPAWNAMFLPTSTGNQMLQSWNVSKLLYELGDSYTEGCADEYLNLHAMLGKSNIYYPIWWFHGDECHGTKWKNHLGVVGSTCFPEFHAILQSMPIEGAMQESSFSDSQFTKQSQPQEFQDLTEQKVKILKIHRIQ